MKNHKYGRPRGTVGKAPASAARGPGFEPPWLVQRSRGESRLLSLVGNGAGAVTLMIDRAGSVFPRGTGRFLVTKGVHMMFKTLVDVKKLSVSSLRQRKDAIRTPFLTGKRPVPRRNTVPARSIGWVTAPAPFPTSERGRDHDSQRDR